MTTSSGRAVAGLNQPAIQSGKTRLGFLPDYPIFDAGAWNMFFQQFTLLMCSLGVFFAGPGTLAIDRLLFPRTLPVKKPRPVPPASPANPAA